MKELWRFLRDEEGPAAPEYAIIAGLIAVVIIGAVMLAGTQIHSLLLNNKTVRMLQKLQT